MVSLGARIGRARFSVFVVRVGSVLVVGAHLLLDVLPVFTHPLVNAIPYKFYFDRIGSQGNHDPRPSDNVSNEESERRADGRLARAAPRRRFINYLHVR